MDPKVYIQQAKLLLADIVTKYGHLPGPRAVVVDALSDQIKKLEDNQQGIFTEHDMKEGLMIGLTFADMRQLYNGGTIRCNPTSVGQADIPITIFLGRTDEHMRKGLEKNPDAKGEFFDGFGEQHN